LAKSVVALLRPLGIRFQREKKKARKKKKDA